MRNFIIASHGTLAAGMYEACEIILGKQENVNILNAYVNSLFNLEESVKKMIEQYPEEEEIIVFTDLLGGSVNNEFARYILRRNFHLFSGVNLACVISGFMYKDLEIDEFIKRIKEAQNSSIVYCNELLLGDSEM